MPINQRNELSHVPRGRRGHHLRGHPRLEEHNAGLDVPLQVSRLLASTRTLADFCAPSSTNVSIAFTINGTSYAVNPTDFNNGNIDKTTCAGAVIAGGDDSWIIGSTFSELSLSLQSPRREELIRPLIF